MPSDLPPGVTAGMIPGNRPEDEAWEKLLDQIVGDAADVGMCDMDAMVAWELGKAAYLAARKTGAVYPHDEAARAWHEK